MARSAAQPRRYSVELSYHSTEDEIAASEEGLRVERTYWLLDEEQNCQRRLKNGDKVAYRDAGPHQNHVRQRLRRHERVVSAHRRALTPDGMWVRVGAESAAHSTLSRWIRSKPSTPVVASS